MMNAPTDNEIMLAEQRLSDARRALKEGASRTNTALRSALVEPRTLIGVAGVSGLVGYLIFRTRTVRYEYRAGAPSTAATAATAAAASTSLVGIVMAFAMRYAMQHVSGLGLRYFNQAMNRKQQRQQPQPAGLQRGPVYTGGGTLH
jgi:hypothetical protein